MGGPNGIQREDKNERVYKNRCTEMIELLKSHEEQGLRFCLENELPEGARDFVK